MGEGFGRAGGTFERKEKRDVTGEIICKVICMGINVKGVEMKVEVCFNKD